MQKKTTIRTLKKHAAWFAAPALGLACLGAQAQSSITLYGVVDNAIQRTTAGGVGSVTGLSTGGNATSRLGFRGSEDLGGGWRAGFQLESGQSTDTGTGRASNTNNQVSGATAAGGFTFDRMAYVSLGHTRYGEVRLGHDFVPTHYNSIMFDPFTTVGVGRVGNFTFSGLGTTPVPSAITASNTVSYWLPKNLGGVYGMVMVASGENASNAPDAHDGNLAGARLGYAANGFDIAAALGRTRYVSTATLGNYTHANLGISWDAGFAKFYGLYNVVQLELLSGEARKHTAELGVQIPVGPGKIKASYARLEDRSQSGVRNAGGSARSDNDAQQVAIGYVYDFSRRTALYGTYARIRNEGQGAYNVSGGRAPLPGRSSSGLELGLRHSF